MFVTFILFQRDLYVVLAHGKGPKYTIHRDLKKTKNPKIFWLCPGPAVGLTVPPDPPTAF